MNKQIIDPSCYSNYCKPSIKMAHVSTPHKYKDGVFKFFVNIKGKVKEFVFDSLKDAALVRRFIACEIMNKGYQICH